MTKYRLELIVDFDSDSEISEINIPSGSVEELVAIFEDLPAPDHVDETSMVGSLVITKV